MGKGEYNHVSVSDTGHIFYQMFLCSRDYNNRDQNAQYTTQPLSDLNFIYNVRSVSAKKVQEVEEPFALIQLTNSIPDKGSPS